MEAQGFRVAAKTTVASRSKSRDKINVKPSSSSVEDEEDYFLKKRRFNGVRRSRSAKSSDRITGKAAPKENPRPPSAGRQKVSNDKENQHQTRSKSTSDRSRSPQSRPVSSGRNSKSAKSSERSKSPAKLKDVLEEFKNKITLDPPISETKTKEDNQEARAGRQSARSDGSKTSKGCKDLLNLLAVYLLIVVYFQGSDRRNPRRQLTVILLLSTNTTRGNGKSSSLASPVRTHGLT